MKNLYHACYVCSKATIHSDSFSVNPGETSSCLLSFLWIIKSREQNPSFLFRHKTIVLVRIWVSVIQLLYGRVCKLSQDPDVFGERKYHSGGRCWNKGIRLKDRPDLSAPSTCKKKKCLYVLVLIEITASDPSKDTGPFLEMQEQEAGQRLKKVDCVKEELRIFITCRTILN